MIHNRSYTDLSLFKEKSWSVKVVDGFITNNRVRTQQCENCDSTSYLVAINHADPNLTLFGCGNRKCKHILMRMRISSYMDESTILGPEEIMVGNSALVSS